MTFDKTKTINDIVCFQEQINQNLTPFALEFWQKLDIPTAQLKSLVIIASQNASNFKSLAKCLGVTAGNVTGIVDRLMEQGLVIRRQDSHDRRITRLEVTEKGRDFLANLNQHISAHASEVLEYMSSEELISLHCGLKGLSSAVKQFYNNNNRQPVNMNRL
jgi:DNA-binding MarR family transcriptional regulator